MTLSLTHPRTVEGDSQRRIENTEDRVDEIVTYINLNFPLNFPAPTGANSQWQAPALNAAKDAFVYQHFLRAPSALQINGALSTGQVLTYNGTDVVGGSAGTVPTATITSGSQSPAVNTCIGINAGVTITLPASPTAGDYIWLIRNDNQNWESSAVTIDRNTRNIEGAASNLSLNKNVTGAFLWYTGATTGWRVAYLPGSPTFTGNGARIVSAGTGSLTSGNLASFDANGNIQDSSLNSGSLISVIRKTTNQSSTLYSSTFVDDTALTMAVAANKNYWFKFNVAFSDFTVGGYKFRLSLPTTVTNCAGTYLNPRAGGSIAGGSFVAKTATFTIVTSSTSGATEGTSLIVEGVISTNANTGNLVLGYASSVATAGENVTVYAGSSLSYREIS